MPRRPSRPVPNPFAFLWPDVSPITEEVRVEVMTKAPAIFYLAALRGLYCRIVGKDKRDTFLWDYIGTLAWKWPGLEQHYGLNETLLMVARLIATAKRPRNNAIPCHPLRLLMHNELAREILEELPRRRNPALRFSDIEKAARTLYERLTDSLHRCVCKCQSLPPPDLKKWMQKERRRTERDIIEYLLAHHHGLTTSALHRRLDEGSRELKKAHKHPATSDL